ncbi:hypothetical protein L7F22_010526 [Adiantum nelumboides]|nr:hypothetical protein [Adiantum nelumboides]
MMRQEISILIAEIASLRDWPSCEVGEIVGVKEAMKEELTKTIIKGIEIKTKAMADSIEGKMDAKEEGWVEGVRKNIQKEVKEEAQKGVDKGKRESVVNMTGSREAVLVSAYACLALGMSGLLWVCWQAQNMQVFALEAAAIACGYIYQCPPFRLSYIGLGEPLCFTAFGPLSTTAFYLSQQTGSLPIAGTILGAATLVGITTTLILFCSHFHQIEGDRTVGKMSPLVRLGTEKGKEVVKVSVIGLYVLAIGMSILKWLPYPCTVLILLTVPIGKMIVDYVTEHHENKEKIFLAKYYCVRLNAAFGVALGLGLVLAGQMGI